MRLGGNVSRSSVPVYDRTALFIPGIVGQWKYWRAIADDVQDSSQIVQLGNYLKISLDEEADPDLVEQNRRTYDYIHRMYRPTDPKWKQVMGPHEMMILNSPERWTKAETDADLRRQWFHYDTKIFTHTAHVEKGRLITHGGLTYGQWLEIGRPDTAELAAHRLNEKFDGTLYQGSSVSLGDPPNFSADPIFAHPLIETYPSWITAPVSCPFGQMHAGDNINTSYGQQLRDNTPYLHYARYSLRRFGSIASIQSAYFWGLHLSFPERLVTSLPGQTILQEKVHPDFADSILAE